MQTIRKRVPKGLSLYLLCLSGTMESNHAQGASKHLHSKNKLQPRFLRNAEVESVISLNVDLGSKAHVIYQSPFLKAGLEQSIKDYLNLDVGCNNEILDRPAFYSVELNGDDTQQKVSKHKDVCEGYEIQNATQGVENRTTCTRNYVRCQDVGRTKCKERVFSWAAVMNKMKREYAQPSGQSKSKCQYSIFDFFAEKVISASRFNYNLDIEVINEIGTNFKLDYKVTFIPDQSNELNQIQGLGVNFEEPVPVTTICSRDECINQEQTMKRLFSHFDIAYDEEKHECLQEGINCDNENVVTFIWLSTYSIFSLVFYSHFSS